MFLITNITCNVWDIMLNVRDFKWYFKEVVSHVLDWRLEIRDLSYDIWNSILENGFKNPVLNIWDY